MNITVSGRHLEVTPALKQYVVDKTKRLDKYCPNIIDVSAILAVEKYRHIAEITVLVGGARINSKEATEDMYSSIDKVLEKIERQLRKHKEKISDHSMRQSQHDKLLAPLESEMPAEASGMDLSSEQ